MEEQFKIKENGFDEIKKQLFFRAVPIVLLAAFGGLAISNFNLNGQSSDANVLPILIPFILGTLGYGLYKGISRQKDIFNSYKLTINDEKIIRQQNLTPDIEIPFNEIKEIVKNKNGAFTIKGEKAGEVIGIPPQLEKFDELELRLSKILEITVVERKSLTQQFLWVMPLIAVGLMMAVYMSENKLLVGFAGIGLTILLIYSLVVTQRSKHVDRKTKRGIWLTLVVLASVIVVTYFKVFGNN